ncbi:hypothetical protein, conserved [Trypanosoma brucei gambiense DAL972]|uniref:MI domain-containing protein n=1 Tax=Trypanosoma brucei gambiense (strain MHOM/CI/86/DAL972) TaxID=679716 RepID=D0A8T4_TRYB9|nr:hypothetical protein, conserved [Trypanosoma brucei gambiense DAL972]CBH18085.1 hypothetical protein, conserved [Trypanosoma brucei gambiense DAL972]|eukprot:XP_011780349.1 hypothetical protein, conserved [Trypanosoma brucei gambiense DAL972]
MSRYIPPHRKRASEVESGNSKGPGDETVQHEAWRALGRSITGIVNRVSGENVELSATELFRENIIRGRGLLCRSLMRAQLVNPDITNVLAALVSRVNKEVSTVGALLCKRLVVQWRRLHRRKDWEGLRCVSRFIGWLYVFNIVNVEVVYQIMLTHLTAEPRTDDDVDQAASLFRETFRSMSQRAVSEFHMHVLTPIRDLLAMDNDEWRLSARAQTLLEGCLHEVQQWERVKHSVSIIPEHLLLVDPTGQNCHEVDLEEVTEAETEEKLDRFVYDSEYEAHEEAYEKVRCAILGDNWEAELLEGIVAAEDADEEEEEGEGAEEQGETQGSVDPSKQLIDERERQIRREVYMAMRSSVRADEVVHKILKSIQPDAERTVCFMVIEGSSEETSYRKIYGMVAERLCKSNTKFQGYFAEAFRLRYTRAEDLEEKQIEYTCKIYVHLLRTDSLPWHKCLSVLDIVENNMSQRLVIQWLLQGLAEAMGMRALRKRFEDDKELRISTHKLFPIDSNTSEEELERAVNMFEAMGLGDLGSKTRGRLEEIRAARRANSSHHYYGASGDPSYCDNQKKPSKRLRDGALEYA